MSRNTAIIGLGIMGRRRAEHMDRHPGYDITGSWDPSDDACAAARDSLPDMPVADSAEQAMAGADLVYLACPPAPRKALAMIAADAGQAVFLEKPLGVDIAESEALVAHLAACGVPAAVNFTQAAGAAANSCCMLRRLAGRSISRFFGTIAVCPETTITPPDHGSFGSSSMRLSILPSISTAPTSPWHKLMCKPSCGATASRSTNCWLVASTLPIESASKVVTAKIPANASTRL